MILNDDDRWRGKPRFILDDDPDLDLDDRQRRWHQNASRLRRVQADRDLRTVAKYVEQVNATDRGVTQ